MTPTSARCSAEASQGSMPRTRTAPSSGRCRPTAHSIAVVLPAPFGPNTMVMEPRGADHDMPSQAVTAANRRVRLTMSTAAVTLGSLRGGLARTRRSRPRWCLWGGCGGAVGCRAGQLKNDCSGESSQSVHGEVTPLLSTRKLTCWYISSWPISVSGNAFSSHIVTVLVVAK